MKKKLAKRVEKLESLRSKMKAKYGASDSLVVDLDYELAEVRASYAILKSKSKPDRSELDDLAKHP